MTFASGLAVYIPVPNDDADNCLQFLTAEVECETRHSTRSHAVTTFKPGLHPEAYTREAVIHFLSH